MKTCTRCSIEQPRAEFYRHCNIGLGHFRDDEARLHSAMLYLRRAVMPCP